LKLEGQNDMLHKDEARQLGIAYRQSLDSDEHAKITHSINQVFVKGMKWDDVKSVLFYQAIEKNSEISLDEFASWLGKHRPGITILWQSQRAELPDNKPDIVIAPCLAVDATGHRVGYGGGYYDKLAEQLPDALWVVAAYAKTVVDKIEVFDHDIRADILVTEAGVIYFDALAA
jgi:5-formyltetrahydrofolate cyclo-ligase